MASVALEKRSNNEKNKFTVQLKTMLRDLGKDLTYLIYKNHWLPGKLNNSVSLSFERDLIYKKGNGKITVGLRSPFVFSDYDYSSLNSIWITKLKFRYANINTRLFGQLGTGSVIPLESQLYVAGANPEELMENKYTRSMGFFPNFDFGNVTNHFATGGGLNLRGYMGYLLYGGDVNGLPVYQYKGLSGASASVEMELDKLLFLQKAIFKNTFKVTPYLFADAGVINTNQAGQSLAFSNVIADAGAGLALTIQRWWKFQTIKPLTIRADFPAFINRLPYSEKDYLQFRWMIGVNRAF
jgi:aminopeptidase N